MGVDFVVLWVLSVGFFCGFVVFFFSYIFSSVIPQIPVTPPWWLLSERAPVFHSLHALYTTSLVGSYGNVFIIQIVKERRKKMKQLWLAIVLYLMAERCLCCRMAQLSGCGLGELLYREQVCQAGLLGRSRSQGRGDQEK